MDNLYNTLQEIRKLPGLYFENVSHEALFAYICGFMNCEKHFDDHSGCLDGFQKFVEHRYELRTNYSWTKTIKFHSISNEQSFMQFYKLFDQFTEEKSKATVNFQPTNKDYINNEVDLYHGNNNLLTDYEFLLLQAIRKDYTLYLEGKSFEKLHYFIIGVIRCGELHNEHYKCLDGFQKFIENFYDFGREYHWSSVIPFVSKDDVDAFDKFYELFDKFIEKKISDENSGDITHNI